MPLAGGGKRRAARRQLPRGSGTNPSLSVTAPIKRADWQQRLTLGPGDTLNLQLFDMPDTAQTEVPIGPDGRISFLQARDIMAAGLTIDELRAKMDEALAKFYQNPRTIITPAAFHSKKYIVLGAVANKGVYTFDRPLSVIEALARAGGLQTGLYTVGTPWSWRIWATASWCATASGCRWTSSGSSSGATCPRMCRCSRTITSTSPRPARTRSMSWAR